MANGVVIDWVEEEVRAKLGSTEGQERLGAKHRVGG